MINNKKVLAIIPARGGSKGLPNKNILPLAGKALIGWTIEVGLSSKYIDKLIVSTDSDEIAEVAKSFNCDVPFIHSACSWAQHCRSASRTRHQKWRARARSAALR